MEIRNIRRKETISSLDTSSMQVGGDPLPHATGCSRFFSQDKSRNQFGLARVLLKRRWQHCCALGDQREYTGQTNCRYEREMYDEPGDVDALGKHRTNPKVILRLRRLILSPTNNQDESGRVWHPLEMQARNRRVRRLEPLCDLGRYTTRPP